MSIFITGDIHGDIDIGKLSTTRFPTGTLLTKQDYLIILGDFGLVWSNPPSNSEKYWLKWLDKKPWTTLFIDGNHENHMMLKELRSVNKFDSVVGKVSNSIFHLRRGHIYNISGASFFCMGGATSTDKESRIEGISWWKEEVPSVKECDLGLDTLKECNDTVDYVIAHSSPISVLPEQRYHYEVDSTMKYLEYIWQNINFRHFYSGHFHMERNVGKHSFLYDAIQQVRIGI